jgi:gluconokinase
MIVVLMGVTGSGKTTIGTLLAERIGAIFADADDYHPAANKQKMAAGHPLNDDDRQPWLEELNRLMLEWFKAEKSGVLACSALKAKYRITLAAGMPDGAITFVWLDGSREVLAHPKLLESQLETLEPPKDALHIVNDRAPEEVVSQILEHVSQVQKSSK